VDFALADEEKAIRETVREFVTKEVMSLESEVLRRERKGEPGLTHEEHRDLQLRARKFGFWGLSTPEEYGGMDLSALMQSLISTELGRTFVPFRFGGEADNILYYANEEQKKEFLLPTIGSRVSRSPSPEPDQMRPTSRPVPGATGTTGCSTARRCSSPAATTQTSPS
jgi:acyl-CoA dehydrogenase